MVNYKIIGERTSFGIEYVDGLRSNPSMLAVRLWIGELPIGTLDDETYLPSFQHQLTRLVNPQGFVGREDGAIVEEGDTSLISLGDTFDDFIVHRFCIGDDLIITVKLVDSPFFTHLLLSVGKTYRFTIPLQFARNIASQFNELNEGSEGRGRKKSGVRS